MSQTLVYMDPNCGACKDVKRILKPAIKAGKVKLVQDGSKEAREILKHVSIKYVPECVVEKDGKFVRCDIDKLVRDVKAGKL